MKSEKTTARGKPQLTTNRKAELVASIKKGYLTAAEVAREYNIQESEVLHWIRILTTLGKRALTQRRIGSDRIGIETTRTPDIYAERLHAFRFSPQEELVVRLLYENRGKAVSRRTIYDSLYPDTTKHLPVPKIVDVLVSYIRGKIRREGDPMRIETVWGVGYELHDPNAHSR